MPRRSRRSSRSLSVKLAWGSAFLLPIVGVAIAVYLYMHERRETAVAIGIVSVLMMTVWGGVLSLL